MPHKVAEAQYFGERSFLDAPGTNFFSDTRGIGCFLTALVYVCIFHVFIYLDPILYFASIFRK